MLFRSVCIETVESGKMTTSYYGLSGSEDLGGGLSGLFKLESFLRADNGEQGRFGGDTQFSRTASVGLAHKDYGQLTLGRNTTALFASTLSFNAFGDSFGYSPSIRHYFGSGQNAVTGDTGWSDSVAYASPNWNGWRFGAASAAKEAASAAKKEADERDRQRKGLDAEIAQLQQARNIDAQEEEAPQWSGRSSLLTVRD